MDQTNILLRVCTALFIGLLIGLQREYAAEGKDREVALGVRTFPLLAMLGFAIALISDKYGNIWLLCTGLVSVTILLAINYHIEASQGHLGLTTKAAALTVLLLGALCFWNNLFVAVALGVAITLLLSVKIELHNLAHHVSREDIYAILKFAVISAIILPVLPDHQFGLPPYQIFNPFKIWLFVVFISAISFIGYVLIKIVGSRKGIELTGLLGGIASSTAVTISFTRRSQQNPELSSSFALAITIAWTVMYVRVIAAVAVLNVALVGMLWYVLLAPVICGLLYCLYLFQRERIDQGKQSITISNPFELGFAIKFGLLFALILFVCKASQIYFGDLGIYLSGFFSGLADVDAIALSVAKLSREANGIEPIIAARTIVIATISNTALKGVFALIGGAPAMKKAIAPGFIIMIVAGLVSAFFIR
jgi:uncharacterized membrane protein (DUF4010 family)